MRVHLLMAAVLSCAAAAADEVILKGGGRVSGRILKQDATSVEVDVGAGTIKVPANRVERIEKKRSPLDDYHDRAAALDSTDRAGWAALGRWAAGKGLSSQSREAYQRVLAIDPLDPEANEAMGNVQLDGRWMSEDAAYQAKGYVQFEGEWLTPAEQRAIESERAQADRERDLAQAQARAREAEARADEAEARAREAEAEAAQSQDEGIPLWWGWGPGPVLWPTQPIAAPRPNPRPVRPSR